MIRQTPHTRAFATTTMAVFLSLGLAANTVAQEKLENLPATMNWSSYGVGSAGYAEASAIADAMGKKYGTRVRLQPSGSAIGRLQPLLMGRSQVGFLATEAFFATEGIHDFSSRDWGPQDLRVAGGRPSSFGIFTARDAGIETLEDLKGKRFAYVAGNPSINVKCDAFLAFAGLTRDDVEAEEFSSYSAAMSSLAKNQSDASCTTTTPSHVYELAESPRGIRWLEVPPEDEKGWERLRAVAPFFQPYRETVGAGISEDEPVNILAYRYPVLTVRADADEDMVYAFTKAVDETYDMYKDATSVMERWKMDETGVPPTDAPFHDGAIKYLKEVGIWTDEHQQWNDTRLARLNALRDAWADAVAEAEGKSDEAFAEIWEAHRQKALGSL